MVQGKIFFLQIGNFNYICKESFTQENRVFARMSILDQSPQHSNMVAILMLVYHVVLYKFILSLKRQFWENNKFKWVLITLCKVLYHPAYVSIKGKGNKKNSSAATKYRLEYVKSQWKGSEIYPFSSSTSQDFLCWPTMVADIFKILSHFLKDS